MSSCHFWVVPLPADAASPPTAVLALSLYLPLPQQIYCHRFPMASGDSEYTSLDFLSKIRLQPKRNIFKHLSLDTDLEEINQVLSPKANPPPPPSTLDRELTRRFVLQLVTQYEGERQANNKWEGFLKSMGDAQTFEVFVQSLKDIKDDRKPDPSANPENESNKNTPAEARRGARSTSCKKLAIRQQKKQDRKADAGVLKKKIREEVSHLKELLLAGQRFLREARNDY